MAATCHQRGHFARNGADDIRAATRTLQSRLAREGIPLEVVPSAEWMMDAATVEQWAELVPTLLTIGDAGKYALLEFPLRFPAYISHLAESLNTRGIVGVLAHVEKYPELLSNPRRLKELLASGFIAQMNADSIAGQWGASVARRCKGLIRQGLIHLVASDAHSVERRPPLLKDAYALVTSWTDAETADLLFRFNPQAILASENVTKPISQRWLDRFRGS